jgi:diacylglycerol kinase family enzyme
VSGPPTIQLYYNPRAGSYSARRLDALVAAFKSEGAGVILAGSVDGVPPVAPEATHVCIAGGDGTIRHVAAMLVEAGCALPVAIHPAGTVNLLAREHEAAPSPRAVARALLRGDARRLHKPVAFGASMFFACASVGPDSAAVALLSTRLKSRIGRAAYLFAFVRLLIRWQRPKLTLRAGGDPVECEAVYVAKGRHYAGPWSFAPHARAADGLLHVLALRKARRRDFLRFAVLLLLRRDPAGDANAIAFTCSELSIEGDAAPPVQADGDIVARCPIDLSVCDRAIAFC